jgi:hypothetical protein
MTPAMVVVARQTWRTPPPPRSPPEEQGSVERRPGADCAGRATPIHWRAGREGAPGEHPSPFPRLYARCAPQDNASFGLVGSGGFNSRQRAAATKPRGLPDV